MADMQSRKKTAGRPGQNAARPGTRTVTDDTKALFGHVRENPLLYAAAAGFILVCLLVAVYIGVSRKNAAVAEMTQFASAVNNEDAAARAAQLGTLTETSGEWSAAAAYLAGESEIRAQNYDKAQEYFQRVLTEFPDSEYAPSAAEALGFLAENRGDNETALQRYREVADKWPNSFPARLVAVKVGRVLEALDRDTEAVDAYSDQFRRFPRAWTTASAMTAIDKLRESDTPDVATAAEAAFKRLSEEFPALFMELYPQFFQPAEEPAVETAETPDTTESGAPAESPAPQEPGTDAAVPAEPAPAEAAAPPETVESPEAAPEAEQTAVPAESVPEASAAAPEAAAPTPEAAAPSLDTPPPGPETTPDMQPGDGGASETPPQP